MGHAGISLKYKKGADFSAPFYLALIVITADSVVVSSPHAALLEIYDRSHMDTDHSVRASR